jgi:hypothetical protein
MKKVYDVKYPNKCCTIETKDSCGNIIELNNVPVTMVNLLLSEFYDGCQLFKSKVCNFWPLMISILNLPLFLRVQLGVGSFLLSLFTGALNTPAERFLLEECLCEELLQFYNGIQYNIDGKIFFVQARLISTILDTKAFEETLHVHASNSYSGCFLCNTGEGSYYGVKTIYQNDHRTYLPITHYLRNSGQSGYCCPANYNYKEYKKLKNDSIETNENSNILTKINNSNKSKNNNEDSSEEYEKEVDKIFDLGLCKESLKLSHDAHFPCLHKGKHEWLEEYLTGKIEDKQEWDWYHGFVSAKFNYDNFGCKAMYAHCNYKDQIIYKRNSTIDCYNL